MSTTSMFPGTAAAESAARLNRTCTACRQRKVKCTPLTQERDAAPVNTCTRCWKNSLDCVFPPPARKKTRRRNEEKIRDLESRLRAVQAAVESGLGHQETESPLPARNELSSNTNAFKALDAPSRHDVTDEFASPDLAQELYHIFINDLAPLYPLVSVPRSSTWQTVRSDQPALFRAMITAASISAQPAISSGMFRETAQFLAEKVVVDGEKSLDLIQALLVLSTWHLPPNAFTELKFSQYAHMAATMGTDLRSSNDKRYVNLTPDESSLSSHELVEICRTFLAVYFLCSSMAMSYRRPTSLPYGPWVEDCLRTLEFSPGVCSNDRKLVEWVKLQRVVEESLLAASIDGTSPVDVSDARARFILRDCIEKVKTWRHSIPDEIVDSMTEMHYQTILITLHEPALYDGHDISDFRPPYALRPLPLSTENRAKLKSHPASSLIPCIMSSQALIRTFLGLPVEPLLFMPVVSYTRVAYAVIVLIKCFVSAKALNCFADLHLETSLGPLSAVSQIISKLELVQDQAQGRVPIPATFHSILSTLYIWCTRVFTMEICSDGDDLLEPMLHLSLGDDKGILNPEVEIFRSRLCVTATHLASAEGVLDQNGLEFVEDIPIDELVTDPLLGSLDFLDYIDHPFG